MDFVLNLMDFIPNLMDCVLKSAQIDRRPSSLS